MIFKKNDMIRHDARKYICLLSDEEYAVFAPYRQHKGGGYKVTINEKLFVVGNNGDYGFTYERIS